MKKFLRMSFDTVITRNSFARPCIPRNRKIKCEFKEEIPEYLKN